MVYLNSHRLCIQLIQNQLYTSNISELEVTLVEGLKIIIQLVIWHTIMLQIPLLQQLAELLSNQMKAIKIFYKLLKKF
jgi:hypothetical protein